MYRPGSVVRSTCFLVFVHIVAVDFRFYLLVFCDSISPSFFDLFFFCIFQLFYLLFFVYHLILTHYSLLHVSFII